MKSKLVKIGGVFLVLAALAALLGATMTLAQDGAPAAPGAPAEDGAPGFGPKGNRGHGPNRFFDKEAYDQALADALGISVEDLLAARETAKATLIQQAVDEGKLTQEQADAILSGEGLRSLGPIVDKEVIEAAIAGALNLSVDELEAMKAEGKRLPQIAEEQGVEMSAVQEAVKAAHAEAIQQAVEDGTITQEQADWLLEHGGRRAPGGPGKHGNGRFGGQPGAEFPDAPPGFDS